MTLLTKTFGKWNIGGLSFKTSVYLGVVRN